MLRLCPPTGPESATYPRAATLKHAFCGHPAVAAPSAAAAAPLGPQQRSAHSAFRWAT